MTFADLRAGGSVFVDANTLVYHFTAHATFGTACTQLLQRIENQELLGFTSTVALGEAMHRLMTTEASSSFGWPFAGIGNRLRTNPAEVQKLHVFRRAFGPGGRPGEPSAHRRGPTGDGRYRAPARLLG